MHDCFEDYDYLIISSSFDDSDLHTFLPILGYDIQTAMVT